MEVWTILDWTNPGRPGTSKQWKDYCEGFDYRPICQCDGRGASLGFDGHYHGQRQSALEDMGEMSNEATASKEYNCTDRVTHHVNNCVRRPARRGESTEYLDLANVPQFLHTGNSELDAARVICKAGIEDPASFNADCNLTLGPDTGEIAAGWAGKLDRRAVE
ncbi:hypothetical protein M405DRAFT_841079 [Rhizopogon salebrosus TDB-379]|nr:hypothetical protein M405DRAFT_841079 [Rhizopogon salebrosus TDB-379]